MKRTMNIELLRIFCMFLIVCFHYCWHSSRAIIFWDTFSLKQVFFFCTGSWGLVGVWGFIAITIWNLCDKEFFPYKKIIAIVNIVLIYTICIYAVFVYLGIAPLSVKEILKTLFVIPYNSYWFITLYVMLLVLMPFLNTLIDLDQIKTQETVKKLLIITTFLIPCYKFLFIQHAPVSEFSLAVYTYFLISYIKHSKCNLFCHKPFKKFLICFLIIIFIQCISSILMDHISNGDIKYFLFNYCISNMQKRWNPILIIMGIWLFLSFNNIHVKFNKTVASLAKSTLAIYLISENPWIAKFLWDSWLNFTSYYFSNSWLIHYIMCVLIIFFICIALDKVRILIFYFLRKIYKFLHHE